MTSSNSNHGDSNHGGHANEARRERNERFLELALDRAGQALDVAEASDFEGLEREVSSAARRQAESFERAAAAIHLACLRPTTLPADLRERLVQDAATRFADRTAAPVRAPRAANPPKPAARAAGIPRSGIPRSDESSARRSLSPVAWLGWVAAAAALIFAFMLQRPDFEPLTIERLASAPDARTLPWSATEDPAASGASGEVVWSTERQAGFMRIRGLASNDPGQSQYQLWIFDATREQENTVAGAGAIPVDGGVFDVTDGEVVVPISAKLAVGRPTLFAVTVERPGGVTVSRQERIVLAAPVD